MSSSESFCFLKLNGENYDIWSKHMQAVLQAKQLWLVVMGDKSSPEKPAKTKPGSMSAADYKTEQKEYLEWLFVMDLPHIILFICCLGLLLTTDYYIILSSFSCHTYSAFDIHHSSSVVCDE